MEKNKSYLGEILYFVINANWNFVPKYFYEGYEIGMGIRVWEEDTSVRIYKVSF